MILFILRFFLSASSKRVKSSKGFLNVSIKTFFKKTRFIAAISSLILLSACTGMNSQLGCKARAGDSCTTIDQVYDLSQRGAYHSTRQTASMPITAAGNSLSMPSIKPTGFPVTTYEGHPVHTDASVQKIWMAPYVDSEGNYHEPDTVYTVLDEGHWIGDSVSAIKEAA